MRGIWLGLLVAACAPPLAERAHVDDDVWGARMLHFHDGVATVRGVLTARGGDRVDWVAFDVPDDLGCDKQEVNVSLKWKAPRGRSNLVLTVYDQTRRHPTRARRDGEHAVARLPSTAPGHYFARISTPGRDDAATYVLFVNHELDMNCELPTDPITTFVRPATYVHPAIPPRMDRAITDVYRIGIDEVGMRGSALLAPGAGVARGLHGMFVDAHGIPIPHGGFDVVEVRDDGTMVFLDEPARMLEQLDRGAEPWTAAIVLPPPPVDAALLSVHAAENGDVSLSFDRGTADGVQTGYIGELVHASGVRVPGARFVIVAVGEHESIGITSAVITDPDHLRAVIGPPSRRRGTP